MKQTTYQLRKHISYEIEVIEGDNIVQRIPTEFTEEKYAKEFVHICNENDVDPIHIPDIMENMLYEIKLSE
jgi:hypothetical protein